jgi:hypothetical protein
MKTPEEILGRSYVKGKDKDIYIRQDFCLEAIRKAQKEAYNEAIEDVLKEKPLIIGDIAKELILKLKK